VDAIGRLVTATRIHLKFPSWKCFLKLAGI
jgi:hypothetical protein